MLSYNVWQTIVVSAELHMCCKAHGNRLDSHISFTSGHSWGALVQWSQWQNFISSKGLRWDHTFSPHLFCNKGYWVSASHPSTEACNTLQKKYFSWSWVSKRVLSTLASFSDELQLNSSASILQNLQMPNFQTLILVIFTDFTEV